MCTLLALWHCSGLRGGIRNANMERIAKLVKIVGMLLQTKVYLFGGKFDSNSFSKLLSTFLLSKKTDSRGKPSISTSVCTPIQAPS